MNELIYGKSSTYKHELDDERMNWLTEQTRRSKSQTLFLYQLVDGNFNTLKDLEATIMNSHLHYCPTTKEQVVEILRNSPKVQWSLFKEN